MPRADRRIPILIAGNRPRMLRAVRRTVGSEVKFNHEGWPAALPQPDLASLNYVWGRLVGGLKKFAEMGKPAPFFP